MSRAVHLNGQAPTPRFEVTMVTWPRISAALLIQAAAILVGVVKYVESLRTDVREVQTTVNSIDRRLSKLDGVPR